MYIDKEVIGKYIRLAARITTIIGMVLMGYLVFPIIFGLKTLKYIKSINNNEIRRNLKNPILCLILVNPTPGLLLLVDYYFFKDVEPLILSENDFGIEQQQEKKKRINKIDYVSKPSLNLLLVCLLTFGGLFFIFPAGAIHTSAAIEDTSEYLADVVAKHTVNGKYVGMVVEPRDGSDKKINNPYTEFHFLYGIFREGLATYIGSANADKSHNISIKDLEDDTNFSILNVDSGFGVKEYYIDETTGEMVYKQEFYPLELMFYSNHPIIPGSYSFLYISQKKADILLDKKGLEHNRDNYYSLLNSLITVDIDGTEYIFAIDNIYFENNYFTKAINEVMGDFLLAGAKLPNTLKKQALFFLRNYSYQNKYYIEYSSSLYSEQFFNYKILNYNFNKGFQINENRLVFSNTRGIDALAVVLIIFSVLMLAGSIVLLLLAKYKSKTYYYIIIGAISLIPYIFFWIIHAISGSVLFFSNLATACEMWILLTYVIALFVVFWIKKSKEKKQLKLISEEVVKNE